MIFQPFCKMSLLIRISSTSPLVYFLKNLPVPISPFSSATNQSSFTVSYLMNSCGLSANKALAASKNLSLKTAVNADSVLALLFNHGFTKTQIREVITQNPELLMLRAETNLQPKIHFLMNFGFSSIQLVELIVSYPRMLNSSLEKKLVPSFNFLKNVLHTNEMIIKTFKRGPWLSCSNMEKTLLPNISLLQKHGIPNSSIYKFLADQPRRFLVESNRFSELVAKVKELGCDPRVPYIFIEAVQSLYISQSKWEAKYNVYRSFGWSEADFLSALRKRPRCMILSAESIRKYLDFFSNKLGLKPSDISSRPNLLLYNLEHRIIPRCTVLQILTSKNLIGKDVTLGGIQKAIQMGERQFVDTYVMPHQAEVPEVLQAYQGKVEFVKLNVKS